MSKRIRYTAVILAAVLLTVSFAAAFFALHEYNHECGENCPLCAACALFRTVLKTLDVDYAILSAVLLCLIILKLLLKPISVSGDTPVMLKVKMTD